MPQRQVIMVEDRAKDLQTFDLDLRKVILECYWWFFGELKERTA